MSIFKNENENKAKVAKGSLSNSKEINDKLKFHSYVINEMHKYMKEFVDEVEEIGTGKLKEQLDALIVKFCSNDKLGRLEHSFDKYKKIVISYLKRSKAYLKEKEDEYKNIIKLLTEGITSISSENNEFIANMTEHAEKLRKIDLLDDIRKIKESLRQEVVQVTDVIKEKSEKETSRLQVLSEKITILRDDLKKAETASMTDKLTGAYNRLAFDKHINKLIDNMGMRWSSFSVLMVDIDNFKSVNDKHGHVIGDRIIAATVANCKTFLRKNDFIARYGGEEFVIILDGMSLKNAERKASKICKKIARIDFVIGNEAPKDVLSFTVSIGISVYREGDTELSIVDRADKALYKAKATGKNRAVSEKDL